MHSNNFLVSDLSDVWGDGVHGPFLKSFSNQYILVNDEMNLENIVNALWQYRSFLMAGELLALFLGL